MNANSLHQDPFLLPLVPRDRGQSLGQSLPTISLLLMPAVNRQDKGIIEWALMGLYLGWLPHPDSAQQCLCTSLNIGVSLMCTQVSHINFLHFLLPLCPAVVAQQSPIMPAPPPYSHMHPHGPAANKLQLPGVPAAGAATACRHRCNCLTPTLQQPAAAAKAAE